MGGPGCAPTEAVQPQAQQPGSRVARRGPGLRGGGGQRAAGPRRESPKSGSALASRPLPAPHPTPPPGPGQPREPVQSRRQARGEGTRRAPGWRLTHHLQPLSRARSKSQRFGPGHGARGAWGRAATASGSPRLCRGRPPDPARTRSSDGAPGCRPAGGASEPRPGGCSATHPRPPRAPAQWSRPLVPTSKGLASLPRHPHSAPAAIEREKTPFLFPDRPAGWQAGQSGTWSRPQVQGGKCQQRPGRS